MTVREPVGEPLTCQQIRELDVLTIEHVGIPGLVLMENAGRGVAEFIHGSLVDPLQSHVVLLCGAGNNGGDGFVVARHLHNAGVTAIVALAVPPDRPRGDAAVNLRIIERMSLPLINVFEPDGLRVLKAEAEQADVIVDALLGTGSRGAPRNTAADMVRIANAAVRPRRVAIDLPSGLDGDTGEMNEPCFRAHATVTMVAAKTGLVTPAARAAVGRLLTVDIGVPRELIPGREISPPGGLTR
ncbi:MAG: NAD(P)H-hydrate epimerase [Phycisphaerae bacterium]|jgi:NAD(P)H-hydrate epimerase